MGTLVVTERERGMIDARARWEVRMARPVDREGLRRWVRIVTGLRLPRKAVCANHQTPLDYLEHVFFEQTEIPDVVVWACRGGGKTMVGAIATLLDMLFKAGTQIRILGGSKEQSTKMYAYLRSLVEEHFEDQLRGRIGRKGFTFKNGSSVEILAQSHTAVRGTRVQKMRCDEVELFDPEVWEAAQLTTRSLVLNTKAMKGMKDGESVKDEGRMTNDQSVAGCLNESGSESRGAVEVYSTMHKVGGLMSELLDPVNQAGRKVFAWCLWDVIERCHPNRKCEGCILWKECGGRAREGSGFIRVADAIAMKRRTSARTWETEMLCFRPYTENQVFEGFCRSMHVRALDLPGLGASVVVDEGNVLRAATTQAVAIPGIDSVHPCGTLRVGAGILRMESLIAGIDFGWRQFACVWLAMLRNGAGERVVWVLDEYVEARRPLEVHAAAMKGREVEGRALRAAVAYCDVAGRQHDAHTGRTSVEELRGAGFRVSCRAMHIEDGIGMINVLLANRTRSAREGRGANDAWRMTHDESMIQGLEDSMTQSPRFFVHPRCEHLAAALESYRRDRTGKPVKDGEHDHILDALRYAIVGHEGRAHGKMESRLY